MIDERPHLSPKFEGARFEKHSIPIELLADLSAYTELIRDVAKYLYKQEDTNRKRVPAAFELAFKLSLKNIHGGSAVAEIVNDVAADEDAEIVAFTPYFNEAKLLVDDTIRCVADEGGKVPLRFPNQLLPQFGKIGRNLKQGELINFGFGEAKAALYSDVVRRTLVLWASNEVEAPVDVVGKVTGLYNEPDGKFDLKVDQGKTVSGPYKSGVEDDIIWAFRHKATHHVRVKGYGIFNKQDALIRILEANDIEILDDEEVALLKVVRRIEQMAKLPDGWCEGEGRPITSAAAEWAVSIMRLLVAEGGLPLPYVFPTPSSEIQFEWEVPNGSIDVRLNPDSRTAELSAYSGAAEFDGDYNLSDVASVNDLKAAISRLRVEFVQHEE